MCRRHCGSIRIRAGIAADPRASTYVDVSCVARMDVDVCQALIGASSVAQLEDNVAALERLDFTQEELAEIDRYATDSGINIWAGSSEG